MAHKISIPQVSIQVRYADLSLGERLGRGGFGDVFKGIWQRTPVAIKKLKIQKLTSKDVEGFHQEAKLMSDLRHPNIVSFFKVCTEPGNYCIVMEFCEKGSLYDWLHSDTPEVKGWVHRKRIALEIARGLWYLHSCEPPIIHRDLKSLNVLLDARLQAKISDFGLSKIKETSLMSIGQASVVGTIQWLPPELVSEETKKHSPNTDMYSFGMVLYEIATLKVPFEDEGNNAFKIGTRIINGPKEKIPDQTPPVMKSLIERCRDISEKRPTAEQAVQELEAKESIASAPQSPQVAAPPNITASLTTLAPPRLPIAPPGSVKSLSAPTSEKEKKFLSAKEKNTGDLLNLLIDLQNKPEIQNDAALSQLFEAKINELAALPEETSLDAENQRFLNLAKRIIPEGGNYNPSVANMLVNQRKESQSKSSSSLQVTLPPPPAAAGIKTSPAPFSVASLAAALPPPPLLSVIPSVAPKIPPKPTRPPILATPSPSAESQSRMDTVSGEEEYQKASSFKKSGNLVEAFNYYLKAAELGHLESYYQVFRCYDNGEGIARDRKTAEEWCQKAAKQGHLYAQGISYHVGWGVPKDSQEAVKWYRKAAEQGHSDAQHRLALCFLSGEEVAKDLNEGIRWLQKAAEQGNTFALNRLARCYMSGEGVSRDFQEAMKWYRKAAEQGDTSALYSLGLNYESGLGVPKDFQEAVKCYLKGAEQGDAGLQYKLATCYERGLGIPKDFQAAMKWYQKAAEQDYTDALHRLGNCYLKGEGVTRDYQAAAKWFQKGAEKNNANAQYSLGYCHANGLGATQNWKEAVRWYQKAADKGNTDAQYSLGYCHANGLGANQNWKEAIRWYQKAALEGHPNAQNNLGDCYVKGQGVAQDYGMAMNWYQKAAAQGLESAKKAFDALANRR